MIPMKRILAFGDIHGMYDRFMNVWEQVTPTKEDRIIFLGDYIDRGNKPIETIEFIMAKMKEGYDIIPLMGNHELMFMEHYTEHGLTLAPGDYTRNGGDITLLQFHRAKRNGKDLTEIIEFIRNLKIYHTEEIGGEKYTFIHAGYDPSKKFEDNDVFDYVWIREDFFYEYNGELGMFIVGHTTVQNFGEDTPVMNENNILMLDTGSFLPNGKISCVDVERLKFYQSNDEVSVVAG